jgi:uncharacterized protein YlaN (UPF0358 family)
MKPIAQCSIDLIQKQIDGIAALDEPSLDSLAEDSSLDALSPSAALRQVLLSRVSATIQFAVDLGLIDARDAKSLLAQMTEMS